jgi:hypothetical protein
LYSQSNFNPKLASRRFRTPQRMGQQAGVNEQSINKGTSLFPLLDLSSVARNRCASPTQCLPPGGRDRAQRPTAFVIFSHQGASSSALQAHRASRRAVIGKPWPDAPLSDSGQRGGCTRRGLVTDAITRCARSLDPGCTRTYMYMYKYVHDLVRTPCLAILQDVALG